MSSVIPNPEALSAEIIALKAMVYALIEIHPDRAELLAAYEVHQQAFSDNLIKTCASENAIALTTTAIEALRICVKHRK